MPDCRSNTLPRLAWLAGVAAALIAAAGLPSDPTFASAPTTAGSTASATPPVGIKARLSTRGDEELDQVLSRLRSAGVTHVRENVSWGALEPRPGDFAWEKMDRWVAAAARRDIEIIALVGGPPGWATPRWNVAPVTGAPLQAFSNFVRALVERYGTDGSFWEAHPGLNAVPIRYYDIWNEPWVSHFWSEGFPDPAGYARMFKAVVETARPADPGARFLLEADTRIIETGWPWKPFLTAMFDAVPDLGDYAYAVSVHPYQGNGASPRTCTPFASSRGVEDDWRATVSQFCRIADIRRILDARGATETKIWITEIGWPTAPAGTRSVSEEDQALYVHQVFDLLRTTYRGLVAGVVWYEYQGPEADPTRDDHYFGLVDAAGNPKPAWRAFQEEARVQAPPAETTTLPPTGTDAPAVAGLPDTRISRHPRKRVETGASRTKVRFGFSSTQNGSHFECKLDAAAWAACSPPTRYVVRPGIHRFNVRAVDPAGAPDRSPAAYRFEITRKQPA